ncbi:hypothetical protein B566_EDAN009355 [Ephemera danica]|nr:hypothetical protein B566_EDAN009355 [Ephemera danica]
MKSSTVFLGFLCLRLLSVWAVQTFFVADEYWQSLEVAHNFVFRYGHKTWEWSEGLRSYFYPGLFAIFYKILSFVGLDTTFAVTTGPRIVQAILTAVADHQFWLWVCEQTGSQGLWAAFSLATSWFYFYCGSRTLINTFETVLTILALRAFPWTEKALKAASLQYMWCVAIVCLTRPTAMIIWLPLCLYHVMSAPSKKTVLGKYVFIGVTMAAFFTLLDSFFYGYLVFTPWNFLKFNVFESVGSFYGSQPFYWYLTIGLPCILGLQTVPFLLGIRRTAKSWPIVETQLIVVILWTVFIYSSVLWAAAVALLAGGVVPSVYFGWFHQQGTIKVMSVLAQEASNNPSSTNILFLMPCHSTPFYSHLHQNVPMRFLTCEPNLHHNATYVDEAEMFYSNPNRWLERDYPLKKSVPSHIVCFDVLVPQIDPYLKKHGYTLQHKLSHGHQGAVSGRVGENVLVYHATGEAKSSQEPIQ